MVSFLIALLTVILVITSLFLVAVVLMQRAKTDGAAGAAMGAGGMEATFGAETGNVLSGATIKAAIVFFVVSFTLYLAHIYQTKHHDVEDNRLPTVVAPASLAPAPALKPAPQPATPAPVEPKKP
ncbi:MAG: preprotein translocase subunit SecG [Lacunisphaera sp.]|nr:preprotein translocase subunit SecG [Lacunisphaera sp.]